jgi:hypothetical protein
MVTDPWVLPETAEPPFSKLQIIFCAFLTENHLANKLSCLSGLERRKASASPLTCLRGMQGAFLVRGKPFLFIAVPGHNRTFDRDQQVEEK